VVAGEVKREKKIKREGGERENALALQAIALYVPSLEMKEIRDGEEERNAFDIVSTAFTFLLFLLPLSFLLSLSALPWPLYVHHLHLFSSYVFLFLIRPAYVI